jgi:hypothetical protein
MSFKEPAVPASYGRCADLYKDVQALRLAMEAEAEEVKAFENRLKAHMIDGLSKSDDTGAAGLKYRVQIVTKAVPRVQTEDDANGWAKLHAYIQKTGRFDLLQKRLGEKAVKDMWAAGEIVPGVEKFNAHDLSITKI